jgi:hypothetical protein
MRYLVSDKNYNRYFKFEFDIEKFRCWEWNRILNRRD